jgi:hypothetical protein
MANFEPSVSGLPVEYSTTVLTAAEQVPMQVNNNGFLSKTKCLSTF